MAFNPDQTLVTLKIENKGDEEKNNESAKKLSEILNHFGDNIEVWYCAKRDGFFSSRFNGAEFEGVGINLDWYHEQMMQIEEAGKL